MNIFVWLRNDPDCLEIAHNGPPSVSCRNKTPPPGLRRPNRSPFVRPDAFPPLAGGFCGGFVVLRSGDRGTSRGRCLAMWLRCHAHGVIFEKQREKRVKPIMRRRDATHGVRSQCALEIASLSLRSSPALASSARKPRATQQLDELLVLAASFALNSDGPTHNYTRLTLLKCNIESHVLLVFSWTCSLWLNPSHALLNLLCCPLKAKDSIL